MVNPLEWVLIHGCHKPQRGFLESVLDSMQERVADLALPSGRWNTMIINMFVPQDACCILSLPPLTAEREDKLVMSFKNWLVFC